MALRRLLDRLVNFNSGAISHGDKVQFSRVQVPTISVLNRCVVSLERLLEPARCPAHTQGRKRKEARGAHEPERVRGRDYLRWMRRRLVG